MSSPRYEILVHRLIDDEITGDERAELDTLMAESAEARAFYESMVALTRQGQAAPVVPAPADLRAGVMQSIDQARYQGKAAQSRVGWREFVRIVFTARLAYGLAAGLILGVAIGTIAMKQDTGSIASITHDEVTGTVGMPASSGRVQRVTNRSFGIGDVTGRLTADQFGGHGTIRITVNSDEESEITLDFDPALATIQAIEQQADGLLDAKIEGGHVILTHIGENSYTAMFRLGDQPLTVTCRVSGEGRSFLDHVNFTPSSDK